MSIENQNEIPSSHIGIERSKKQKNKYYGAIDLGTNNCRLLIAHQQNNGFKIVSSFSKIVRLGEGLTTNGFLSEVAMIRTLKAISTCADRLKHHNVTIIRSIATEACRQAKNCEEFFYRIEKNTGLKFETISSKEEAHLAMVGCKNLLTENCAHTLAFDIGGGSTEIIWSNLNHAGNHEIKDVLSLPFGVLTLSENYDANSEFNKFYNKIVNQIMNDLRPFCTKNGIQNEILKKNVQMLGIAGTVTTLGAVHQNLSYYKRSKIDGLKIRFKELVAIAQFLSGLDFEARAAIPCVGQERAKLILPGCAILEAIFKLWPVGQLRVADRGLREGILMELMEISTIGK